jgi:ferritin
MLTQKMQSALNEQIQNELASAYLYLAMSAYLEDQNFAGAAHWMREQYKEELEHAAKLYKLMVDRHGRVRLEGIAKPQADFGTLKDTFQAVLAHEKKVTATINSLYEVALAEKDYASQIELQWFVKEQIEEEKGVEELLAQLEACDGKPHLLLMIDRHLGKRGS